MRKGIWRLMSGAVIVVAIISFIRSVADLSDVIREYQVGEEEYQELEAEYVSLEEDVAAGTGQPRCPVVFKGLAKKNSDIRAWLVMDDGEISYPIVQGEDNDFYLHHTLQKALNFAGCLFLDYKNAGDFSDRNSVIYGHNMKSGAMFGKLKNYKNVSFRDKYPCFWIHCPLFSNQYVIFSCREVSSHDPIYNAGSVPFEFEEICNKACSSYKRDLNISFSEEDKVVTLSTCSYSEEVRLIVQGKLINTIQYKGGD